MRLDEVRNPDDFVLLVVLDHIRLLDDGDEVLGVANLPLQALPDLFRPGLSVMRASTKDDNNVEESVPSPQITI